MSMPRRVRDARPTPFWRGATAAVGVALLIGTVTAADEPLTEEAASRLEAKLAKMLENAGASSPERLLFRLSEGEVNSYLRLSPAADLPAGVTEPYLGLAAEGRWSLRAVIDVKALAADLEESDRQRLSLISYLGDVLPLRMAGTLRAGNGEGTVDIESVVLSGIPLPAALVRSLVRQATRSATLPDGLDVAEPFALPAAVQEIRIGTGEALVLQ